MDDLASWEQSAGWPTSLVAACLVRDHDHDRDLGWIRLSNGDRPMLGGYGIGTAAEPDNVEVGLGPWIKEPDPSCPALRWVAEQVDTQGH